MTRRCVLLFARSPRAEARAKRLPGTEALFALAGERVADAAAACGFDLLVVGEAEASSFSASRIGQRGRDFGDRLANALADAAARGYSSVVVVPGDVPGFDRARLAAAGAALEEGRLVLGPSPDGGVYLLGLPAGASPSLLAGVRWRTGAVFRDLVTRARDLPVRVLKALPDLDRSRDLEPLVSTGADDERLVALVRHIRKRDGVRSPSEVVQPSSLFRSLAPPLRGPPASA